MTVDLQQFFQATDPSRTLAIDKPEDKKVYIDFSSVRGGDIIKRLKQKITVLKPNQPTCALFTGHIGCGKSTELLRLKKELEEAGFHVVYFESSEDLEMSDVDIADVLLSIARRIIQSLEEKEIPVEARGFKLLLEGVFKQILNSEIKSFSISLGIAHITAKARSDSLLREKLNQFLGPQKSDLLNAINRELIEPAIIKLKEQGEKGLVVIVDNLDRIDSRNKLWGRPQQEYLFVDQGEFLTRLNCHMIYTMPLALKFSNEYGNLTQRFIEDPKVLPMVPVRLQNGSIYEEGMTLLRQMILARAFPDLTEQERLNRITEIFDSLESLDRLCQVSGGHVRDLLRLLNEWIQEEMELPLSRQTLEIVICNCRNDTILPISDEEWKLLRQVRESKRVSDDEGYQKLIRSRFVFEYRNSGEFWFDINPILAEAKELQ